MDGDLGNSLNFNGNPCGSLHTVLTLQPGETKTIAFLLAQKGEKAARALLDSYANVADKVDGELKALVDYWHGELSGLTVNTPDANFNSMINTWNAFQCFTTFVWSRAASLIYCGQRNGLGYRDTVQDIQGIIHLDPKMAKERLVFMLSAQVHHGGGLPLVKFNHNAGHEDSPRTTATSAPRVIRIIARTMRCGCSRPFTSISLKRAIPRLWTRSFRMRRTAKARCLIT